ncbi:hypothetical protein KI387_005550, partial [Taxus chinensis]
MCNLGQRWVDEWSSHTCDQVLIKAACEVGEIRQTDQGGEGWGRGGCRMSGELGA